MRRDHDGELSGRLQRSGSQDRQAKRNQQFKILVKRRVVEVWKSLSIPFLKTRLLIETFCISPLRLSRHRTYQSDSQS